MFFPFTVLLIRACIWQAEVLQYCTCANVTLNSEAPFAQLQKDGRVHTFSGDWTDPALAKAMGEGTFDLIVTSETVYSPPAIPKLLDIVVKLLRRDEDKSRPTPCAFVAGKRYYFGVRSNV